MVELNADIRTVLSLCAGYGGLDLGFHRAFPGARTVCYVENEIPAAAILAHNIEKGRLDDAPIWSDLKTFDPRPFRGRADAILGGYPCQPFSVAGQRRGTEDPRHLWPYIARIVETIQPRICVFENVRGHVRLGLSEVLGELGELGYRVRAGIFSAAEVGAPHRRERVFILAYSEGWRREAWRAESEGRERERAPIERSPGNMEHASRITKREQDDETTTEPRQDARTMPGRGRASLAHRIGEGLQGHARDGAGSLRQERKVSESDRSVSKDGLLWPSRPGEPQHEWEEPRTVDRKLNPSWVAQLMGLPSDWVEVEGLTREMKLRALGNGVVPQQAELAIRTLRAEPLQSQEPQGPRSQTSKRNP